MRNIIIGICLLAPGMATVWGQQLAYSFKVDTFTYELKQLIVINEPWQENPNNLPLRNSFAICLHKKNTDQYDIFDYSGKTGSCIIHNLSGDALISQYFIDADTGWECIINEGFTYKLIDDNGGQLLSDSGNGFYGYDGQNTYVCSDQGFSYRAWRFPTGVTSSAQQKLSKTSSTRGTIMTYLPPGDFHVTLQPTGGGPTTLQIFDFLGRLYFSKTIKNIKEPQSFIISSESVPRSPFIAKVNSRF
jgi:hypothetical protein